MENTEKAKLRLFSRKTYIYNTIIAILFVISLLIYIKLIPGTQKPLINIQSYSEPVQIFYEPDMGKDPVIKGIENAKTSIEIEVYTFSDTDILRELVDAKKRGVNIRVILEENPYGGYSANREIKNKLSYYGIESKWDNKAYNYTHSKFMIIDGKTGYIMTLNLTKSAFTKNREFGVIVQDERIVNELEDIFGADWKRYPYKPKYDSSLVISPENSRAKIENLLNSAHSEILIYAEEIDDPAIKDILKRKGKYIDTKVIIASPESIENNSTTISELKRYGIDIKYLSSLYIHAKVIIVDRTYAFVGSENLSSNSLDNNREVGIILSHPDIINKLREIFLSDFTK